MTNRLQGGPDRNSSVHESMGAGQSSSTPSELDVELVQGPGMQANLHGMATR